MSDTVSVDENPFGPAPTGWRAAPDCGRCGDTGVYERPFRSVHDGKPLVERGCCSCKKGRRRSEVQRYEAHGLVHPDGPSAETRMENAAGL